MQAITHLSSPVYIKASAAVGGHEEGRGPLGKNFDFIDDTDLFGMNTFERAEGEMSRIALNIAIKKAFIEPEDLSLVVAGDLQNQCVASSGGLFSFGVPYLGLYGACSTLTEGLMVLSSMMSNSQKYRLGACLTSSHNSAAERQFRTPLEYGSQRAKTAQWTATAAGAYILSKEKCNAGISAFMPGRIIDGYSTDASNMGAAMALSAKDSIENYFSSGEEDPMSYDLILTGDLGEVGSNILRDLLTKEMKCGFYLSSIHRDCGLTLYDRSSTDCHSGASGCGCSASVLSSYVLPMVMKGEIRKMLLMSTGALMSLTSTQQGEHIFGISPAVKIEHFD